MDEFVADLRELDESQERVEAVSNCMLRAQSEGDAARAQEMVTRWVGALRASDVQAERVAFLFVANHVLLKSQAAAARVYVDLFAEHLAEAVALVSNSPMDRQHVTHLLELWHTKAILELWKYTGEDLLPFLHAAAASDGATVDGEQAHGTLPLAHALPMKLNARSANPALDVLKQIDHTRAVIRCRRGGRRAAAETSWAAGKSSGSRRTPPAHYFKKYWAKNEEMTIFLPNINVCVFKFHSSIVK